MRQDNFDYIHKFNKEFKKDRYFILKVDYGVMLKDRYYLFNFKEDLRDKSFIDYEHFKKYILEKINTYYNRKKWFIGQVIRPFL